MYRNKIITFGGIMAILTIAFILGVVPFFIINPFKNGSRLGTHICIGFLAFCLIIGFVLAKSLGACATTKLTTNKKSLLKLESGYWLEKNGDFYTYTVAMNSKKMKSPITYMKKDTKNRPIFYHYICGNNFYIITTQIVPEKSSMEVLTLYKKIVAI